MNIIDDKTLQKANDEAIYNLYLYLANDSAPQNSETLRSAIYKLETAFNAQPLHNRNNKDVRKLEIIKNYINRNSFFAESEIHNLTYSRSGLTACCFTKPDGDVSFVFKGTGSGEWIDNGEGLSGIPEENTYITYKDRGRTIYRKTVPVDYATDQQTHALNWFYKTLSENGWNKHTNITVSGHSKGGNKAQFIAIHSDLVDNCYSFDGQGFSPEALEALKKQYPYQYEIRREKIMSFSADNDYVNVLGKRLAPKNNIYYFKSKGGFHYLESLLDFNGNLHPQCRQGRLAEYMETVSEELMKMNPKIRQYATLGVMNIFQKYLGEGVPVNGDTVSVEKTIIGIAIATGTFLYRLHGIYK